MAKPARPQKPKGKEAKAKLKLEEKTIERLTSDGKPDRLYADHRQRGLYLRVLVSGRKSWLLRTREGGRWRVVALGEWRPTSDRAGTHKHPHLKTDQARQKAAATLGKLAERQPAGRGKLTLGQAANEWYADRIETKRTRPEQVKLYLDRDLGTLASKPLVRITPEDITRLVAAKAPVAGNRLLAIVKQLFRHATLNRWLEADPLSLLNRENAGRPERERDRVLTDDEIRGAWAIEVPHGNVYRLLLASGQRLGEVLALADDTTQIRGDVWVIPDTKSGRPHRVPVLPLMARIVKDGLPKKKRAATWQMWRNRMPGCDATLHDIRRTVATRLRELRVPIEVIEALLNHKPTKLVRTYQQPDMTPQIAEALKKWHRELQRLVRNVG